jgi:methyl-accepting chemotaxis protein
VLQSFLKSTFLLFQRTPTTTNFVMVCGMISIAYTSALGLFFLAIWDSGVARGGFWVLLGSVLFVVNLYVQFCRAVFYRNAQRVTIDGLTRIAKGDLTLHFMPAWGRFEGQALWNDLYRMNKEFPLIIQRVRDTAQRIEVGSREIATGYVDLAKRTEQQSRTLEEMTVLLEQVLATVNENAMSSRRAERVVAEVGQYVAQAVGSMQQVTHTMARIERSTQKVVEFVGIVQSIALQTNILALNAAVEAACAGEQGQGFAVVADEVRDLAHRSAEATAKIKALIASSTERVVEGVTLLAEATHAFDAAAVKVGEVTQVIGSVALISNEQSGGVQSVTQALPQLENVTQKNAAMVHDGVRATQALEKTAARLVEATRVFQLPAASASKDDVPGRFESLICNLKLTHWLAVLVHLPVSVCISIPGAVSALVFGLALLGGAAMTLAGALSAIEANGALPQLISQTLPVVAMGALGIGAYLFLAFALFQNFSANWAQGCARRLAAGDLTWEVRVFGTEATTGHLESYGMTRALFDTKQHFTKVVREVRASAGAIESSAHDIAQGYDHLAQQAQTSVAAFERASAKIEELQATAVQNADHCQTAKRAAEDVRERAEQAVRSMQRVTSTMTGIEQSAAEMKQFIGVIESIAFQTNILALNAAVEAVRAGEQGRGFAVVAAEVRTLAQRSARATDEVKGLITESVQYAAEGATLVREAEKTLQRVVTGVHEAVGLIGAIAKASVEQTADMQQIGSSLRQLKQVAHQSAVLVEEGVAAAESFDREGAGLAQSVGVFRLEESGAANATSG